MKKQTPVLKLLVGCLFIFYAFTGCEKSDPAGPGVQKDPPQIPPLSTFLMDFSDFESRMSFSQSDETGRGVYTLTVQNWGWSALQVGVWNVLITATFIIPVAAFAESFNHEAEQQPDGSWCWAYEVQVNKIAHSVKLYARTVPLGIQWDMVVSKEGAYTDFNWYSGLSNLLATEGTWTVNKNPQDPVPCIAIVWHRNPQDDTADIRYTNIIPGDAENGGYIYYGVTQDPSYDAFYEIYNKGRDNLSDIRWNRSSKNGRIKDPQHFCDDRWHCWDQNLQDMECP